MNFAVGADAYASFMGRYSEPLASQFADLAGARAGQRALDVGCGPGALTAELAVRLGEGAVCAVEPSWSFAQAVSARLPGVPVGQAVAERLPFRAGIFDLAAAQLVVHFMTDPVAGLRELGRVTRRGGTVAACVWDHAGGRGPLSTFWQAALELDPAAKDESALAGARAGHLAELAEQAGLGPARTAVLTVTAGYPSFGDWWQTYTLGIGPAGAYLESLDPEHRAELRERCRRKLPGGPIDVVASAWAIAAEAAN